jgi:hypothetical protein
VASAQHEAPVEQNSLVRVRATSDYGNSTQKGRISGVQVVIWYDKEQWPRI